MNYHVYPAVVEREAEDTEAVFRIPASATRRHCKRCNAVLSSYNAESHCQPCQKQMREIWMKEEANIIAAVKSRRRNEKIAKKLRAEC